MRILINAVSAKSGGAAIYIRNMAYELTKVEGEYQYIFYVPPVQAKAMKTLGDRVTVVATDVGYESSWRRFLWDQIVLRRTIGKEKVDILLSSSDFGMLFPRCRQILIVRNSLFFSQRYLENVLPYKTWRFKLEILFRRRLVSLSATSSDVVITASQTMLDDVRQFISIPDHKAEVNYFGVPLETFEGKRRNTGKLGSGIAGTSQEEPLRMLYVSEYSDYKNLTTLLKAVLLLREQGVDDFCLTTTADPGQFPDVEIVTREIDKALASNPRIASHVKFIGSIPYEKIQTQYQESDLFVFPSLAESFGHPLAEAMASGLAVIASDIPVHREICAEAAEYFSPLDPKDLAEKIVKLRNNPELRRQLGRTGRKRTETHFDWKDHVRRLVETFEKVATKTGGVRSERKSFSYELEKSCYSRRWPEKALSYEHLEPYLRCWLDPERVFGGKRVLDIGAGECTYTRLIADRFGPKEIVTCELFHERMLPAFRANRNPVLKFVAGDCFRMPFQNDSFDVVFGSLVLHQIPEFREVISEVRRVLSDCGSYVGLEPSPFHLVYLYRYLRGIHSPNQYLFGPKHLAVFEDGGFEVTVRYFYAKHPRIRNRFLGTCMGIIAEKRQR